MQPIPHPNDASDEIWLKIGQLVLEIFMFESVDAQTDARTPAQVPYYKLTLSFRLWWAKNESTGVLTTLLPL